MKIQSDIAFPDIGHKFPRTVYPRVLPIEYTIRHNFLMSLSLPKSSVNKEHESELLDERT
jgi:hypothetical protein